MNTSGINYKSAATDRFAAIKNTFDLAHASFWKLGTTFDTLIDYLEHIDQGDAEAIADKAIAMFDSALGNPPSRENLDKTWFDDFGWWCVAFKRATDKPFFASRHAALQKRHDLCWQQFSGNAPFVWERRTTSTFNDYGPAVEGGVWNEYWYGTPEKYLGPKDGDPRGDQNSLQGIQNTVTNAVYLMAAQRQSGPEVAVEARKERNFLFTWMDMKENSLWWETGRSEGLVRERVGHFAGKNTPSPGFMKHWAWAGDQGLMLSNLCDSLSQTDPITHQKIIDRAMSILNGAKHKLTSGQDNIILNSTDDAQSPDGDINDYQTGSGIFWRNILHIYTATGIFRPTLSSPAYQQIIRASANAAANSPGESFDAQTNQLAALVTASVILS